MSALLCLRGKHLTMIFSAWWIASSEFVKSNIKRFKRNFVIGKFRSKCGHGMWTILDGSGNQRDGSQTAPINSCIKVVVRSPTPFGLGRNGCWPSRGSQLPRALPFIFSLCCPPERPQKGSTQLLQNRSHVFSFSLLLSFSCPSSSPHSSSVDER